MEQKRYISNYSLFVSIIVAIIGVGTFSFPQFMADLVGSNGWIVIILAGLIGYLYLYLSYKCINMNGYMELHEIIDRNFGRVLGIILAAILTAYNVFTAGLGMRVFIEVIKMYLLERTPTEFLIITTILVGTYLIRGELEAIIKFNEISFWVMFISIVIVLIFLLNQTDFTNLLPTYTSDITKYYKALKYMAFNFTGAQTVFLLLPRAKDRSRIKKVLFRSMLFITIFYVIIFAFVIAVFSEKQTKILIWPTITMITSINIPSSFIERWQGVVMALWILFYFTTFANSYYFSAELIKDVFDLKSIKISCILVMPFIYGVALYATNIAEVYDTVNYALPIFTAIAFICVPLILLISSKRRQKGDERKSVT